MATLKLLFSFLMFMVYLSTAMSKTLIDFSGSKVDANWYDAHATFYEGACGYGDLFKQWYGLETTALSTALFNNGLTCDACFEIKCDNYSQWCIPNASTAIVTATNFCPPTTKATDNWCTPLQKHFDLSMPKFTKLAQAKARIIHVNYRRVLCSKKDGVQFQVTENPNSIMVVLYNVEGAGDIKDVKIKDSGGGWI
ncbi:hypothetical protein PTKIN_Ptkin07bG0064200 [Pterospermum kingtungense]